MRKFLYKLSLLNSCDMRVEKTLIQTRACQLPCITFQFYSFREQIRKEIIDRPVGHVKPIQNVQANSSPILRPQVSTLPTPIQPPGNPLRPNLPSMAFMAGLTFPPLLNNRYGLLRLSRDICNGSTFVKQIFKDG